MLNANKKDANKQNTLRPYHNYLAPFMETFVENKVVYICAAKTNQIAEEMFLLYEYLLKNSQYKLLKHCWIYSGKCSNIFDKIYDSDRTEVFLINEKEKNYKMLLASAKYILYENSLPSFFVKKDDQVCVNLWLDIPLLKIGLDAKAEKYNKIWRIQKSFYSCDFLITRNSYATSTILNAFDVSESFDGTVIELAGISSNKTEYQPKRNEKVVVYAPVVKTVKGKVIDSSEVIKQQVVELKSLLSPDFKVNTKLEPVDYDSVANNQDIMADEIGLLPCQITDEELLEKADVLITDFSQLMFKFSNADKQVFLFHEKKLWDMENSAAYFSPDELPGKIYESISEIAEGIQNNKNNKSECLRKQEKTFKIQGLKIEKQNVKNIADAIFEGSIENMLCQKRNIKKLILLHAGRFESIAKRELCIHLLKQIDYKEYTVLVDGRNIYSYCKELKKISNSIQIINSQLEKNIPLADREILEDTNSITEYKELFQWVFQSRYGRNYFDVLIDMDGTDTLWANLMIASNCGFKAIIVNSNNREEFIKEFADKVDKTVVVGGDIVLEEKKEYIHAYSDKEIISQYEEHHLKILFISAFDSTNYVFVNLINGLQKKGHSCVVVVKSKDDLINNKMYMQANIDFIEIDEFPLESVDMVDFVFSAPFKYICYKDLYKRINARNKFVITFSSLFSSVVMGVFPDLSLSIGKCKFKEYAENGLKYNQIAIGNPQYDHLIASRREVLPKEIKKVLIMEQGAYPFGKKGKKQLADVLCHIARQNPDMEFTIKPRYLLKEEGKQLHVLSEHLYQFIKDKPQNLILINTSLVLEDIMGQYDAAITTWSTSFLDAAVLGMPLMLIEGLDSIDIYNVRKQRVEEAYKRLRESGCVVNYKDLYKEEKLSFCRVSEDFLKNELYRPEEICVPKIIDLLNFLYKDLILTERRWKKNYQFEYDDFLNNAAEIELISVNSNEYQQRKQLFGKVNVILQKFIFENRCMEEAINVDSLCKVWDYEITENTESEDVDIILDDVNQTVRNLRNEFFENNYEMVKKDRILQDYYFQWLFLENRYSEIMNFRKEVICPESLYFYKAVVLYKRMRYKKGTQLMIKFFEISQNKECKDLRKDMDITGYLWNSPLGKYVILWCLSYYKAYGIIVKLDPEEDIYQKNILRYYKMKSLIKLNKMEDAVTQYKNAARNKIERSKGKNWKKRIKNFVASWYAKKTKKMYVLASQKINETK